MHPQVCAGAKKSLRKTQDIPTMAFTRVLDTPELLCQIFEDCLPAFKLLQVEESPRGLNAPLVLTHVNRRWRDMALSCSRLWTSFHLNFENRNFVVEEGGSDDTFLALIEWLKRSGQHPFSLLVTCDVDDLESWGNHMSLNAKLNKILFDHRSRWEDLYICLPLTCFEVFHQEQNLPSFPQLKVLSFCDRSNAGDMGFRLGEVPKLETLRLAGKNQEENFLLLDSNMPPSIRDLWLATTTLKMGNPHPTGITILCINDTVISLDELSKFPLFFPLLHTLVGTFHRPQNFVLPETSVVFHNLHILMINYITTEFPMMCMTTPKLESLGIRDGWSDYDETEILTLSSILSFLKRSECSLKHVRFNALEMTHEDFVELLDMAPDLEVLELVNLPISIASLMALFLPVQAESSAATMLRCPLLRTLCIGSITIGEPLEDEPPLINLEARLVRSLLMTRCVADPSNGVEGLKSIVLPIDPDDLEQLQREWRRLFPESRISSNQCEDSMISSFFLDYYY